MSLDIELQFDIDTGGPETTTITLFDGNITHNVAPMWRQAGVYHALYESPGELAESLIEALENGIKDMQRNPEVYKAMNPANGWGDYEGALGFLQEFTKACKAYQKAVVWVSR